MDEKIVFQTHVDAKGKIREAKEIIECPKCNGECYILHESVSPSGVQSFLFNCTDCLECWTEYY